MLLISITWKSIELKAFRHLLNLVLSSFAEIFTTKDFDVSKFLFQYVLLLNVIFGRIKNFGRFMYFCIEIARYIDN